MTNVCKFLIRGEEKFIKKIHATIQENKKKTSQLCFNFAFACNEIYDLRLILKARKHAGNWLAITDTFFFLSPRAEI